MAPEQIDVAGGELAFEEDATSLVNRLLDDLPEFLLEFREPPNLPPEGSGANRSFRTRPRSRTVASRLYGKLPASFRPRARTSSSTGQTAAVVASIDHAVLTLKSAQPVSRTILKFHNMIAVSATSPWAARVYGSLTSSSARQIGATAFRPG